MKTVGIIGGLGPQTTSDFYSEISFLCQEINKKNRPSILIYSIPISYAIEEDAITKGKGEKRLLPSLVDAAKRLEKAGADFLVMPCNSLHEFINEIKASVKIPFLSMTKETVNFLKEEKINKVGIISTPVTINKKIYENSFMKNGIEQVVPDNFDQFKIGKIIHNLVLNKHTDKDKEELISVIDGFKERNIDYIILACTDLQLLIPNYCQDKILSTTKILANATVQKILD